MVELLVVAVSDAFLDVGVVLALVAVVVLLVGPRCGGAAGLLHRHPQLGPVLGAGLGVLPGCSGALVVTPLFARGHVSLGTLVATLVATTGDSAWALWAGAPRAALVVHAVTLGLGVAVGCAVDTVRAGALPARAGAALATTGATTGAATGATAATRAGTRAATPTGGVGGCCSENAPAPSALAARLHPRLRLALLAALLAGFWTMTGAGAAAALGAGLVPGPGDPPPSLQRVVGALGFAACVGLLLRARGRYLVASTPGKAAGGPLRRAALGLDGAATQAAFVIVWVGVAYAGLAVLEVAVGSGAERLQLDGPAAVLAGTVVGALPGCGLQIAWVGLYLDGAVGFPGLLANAVAQDGDALLPLLVLRRRLALGVTALTSVPALLAGTAALLLV